MDLSALLASLGPLADLSGGGPEPLPSVPMADAAPMPMAGPGQMPMPGQPLPDPRVPMPTQRPPDLSKHHHAADFVRQMAPLILSTIAAAKNPLHGAAILNGSTQGMLMARQEQMAADARAADTAKLQQAFIQHALTDVKGITDPHQQAKYLTLLDDVGAQQFGMPKGWTQNLPVPRTSETDRLKAEVEKKLAAFDKDAKWKTVAGTPQEAKISFQLSNGQSMPVSSARRLVGQQFTDEQGLTAYAPAPAPKPEKKSFQHVEAIVAGRRRFVNFDPGTGKYFDPMTGAEVQATPAPSKAADAGAAGGGGAAMGLDADGLEYGATLFRLTNTMPSLGMGKTPDRYRIINRAAAQAKSLGQTPAAAIQRTALYKADAKSLERVNLLATTAQAAESKASGQIEIIRGLSGKVPRTRFPFINQAILSGQTSVAGDPDATALLNAISTFANEYGKIIEGSTGSVSGSSDSARHASERLVNAAMNPAQLSRVLDLMQREMALTLQGYDVTIQEVSKRMGGAAPAQVPDASPAAPSAAPGGTQQIGRFKVRVSGGG